MRRITGADTIELAPGKLGYRDRNDSAGVPGTQFTAAWFNDVQEEVLAVIEGVGLAPAADRDQLYKAIRALTTPYAADTGAANALVVNVNRPGWSLIAGAAIRVKVLASVVDDATINIRNGVADLGTFAVVRPDGSALCPYDLVAGQIVELTYDGAAVQIPRVEGRTGDMLMRLDGAALAAHVPLNGRTIGPAGSGATARAHADCRKLYVHLYDRFSDAICPVTSGRGLNAAADWAAGKPLRLQDTRCKMPIGVDGMGGAALSGLLAGVPFTVGDAATLGASGGEARHVLTELELAPHDHDVVDPGHDHSYDKPSGTVGVNNSTSSVLPYSTTASANTSLEMTGITIANAGGGQPHNNMPPFVTVAIFARL